MLEEPLSQEDAAPTPVPALAPAPVSNHVSTHVPAHVPTAASTHVPAPIHVSVNVAAAEPPSTPAVLRPALGAAPGTAVAAAGYGPVLSTPATAVRRPLAPLNFSAAATPGMAAGPPSTPAPSVPASVAYPSQHLLSGLRPLVVSPPQDEAPAPAPLRSQYGAAAATPARAAPWEPVLALDELPSRAARAQAPTSTPALAPAPASTPALAPAPASTPAKGPALAPAPAPASTTAPALAPAPLVAGAKMFSVRRRLFACLPKDPDRANFEANLYGRGR